VSAQATYDDLLALFKEYRKFVSPKERDGIADYTAAAMKAQHDELKQSYQQRLADMDISSWPVSEQVDYHIVRAEMNGLDFYHRVIRPWFRDPGFYCTFPRFEETMKGAVHIPGEFPIPADKLEALSAGIKNLPALLEQAMDNLTETAADFAIIALRMKKSERENWTKFVEAVGEHHPELVDDGKRVVEAVDKFIAWLEDNADSFAPNAGVGEENWNWFMKNVYLFPYTWEEAHAVVLRELDRAETYMRLEEFHNKDLPEQAAATSLEEHQARFEGAMARLKSFLEEAQIFDRQDEVIKYKDKPTGFTPPDPKKMNFFQEILARDILPLMTHDICGHTHDWLRYKTDKREIRSAGRPYHICGLRAEGLATGIEEILTHLGLCDDRPRSRELAYVLVSFRAARAAAALKMHSHELDFKGGLGYASKMTSRGYSKPDTFLLWDDLELYIRQPGYGMGYLTGKTQIESLIADYSRVKGDEFSLRGFFDEYLDAGFIPMSLIRWEITGLTDEMEWLQS
jgi:hypothetical protein